MSTITDLLGASIATQPGTPSPGDLYSAAAPRAMNIMRQYDAASPGIDFATKYWWLIAVLSFGLGIGASFVGTALYDKYGRR